MSFHASGRGYRWAARMAVTRALLQRHNVLLGLITGMLWFFLQHSLWRSVLSERPTVGSFDWPRMETYILLATALGTLLPVRGAERLFSDARSGGLAVRLVQPWSYFGGHFAECAGEALVDALVAAGAFIVLGLGVLDCVPPAGPLALGASVLSAALGFVMRFQVIALVAVLSFRMLNVYGLLLTTNAVVALLSGALMPPELLGPWAVRVVGALPFQGIVLTPISLYLGSVQGFGVAAALGQQVLWMLLLGALLRAAWRANLAAMIAQGG